MGDPEGGDPTARARVAIGVGIALMVVGGWFLVTRPIGSGGPPPTLEELVSPCDQRAVQDRLTNEEWTIGGRWLLVAVRCDNTSMVRDALDAGASPDSTDDGGGWSALHEDADEGALETVDLLLERGADPDAASERGSPLLIASFDGRDEVAIALLDGGADVDSEDPDGWTPFVAASSIGDAELVEMLLARGADIDHRTNAGDTALLRAATNADAPVVDLLLGLGADASISSRASSTGNADAASTTRAPPPSTMPSPCTDHWSSPTSTRTRLRSSPGSRNPTPSSPSGRQLGSLPQALGPRRRPCCHPIGPMPRPIPVSRPSVFGVEDGLIRKLADPPRSSATSSADRAMQIRVAFSASQPTAGLRA